MYGIILYLTQSDTEIIRNWLNDESDIFWIIKAEQNEYVYKWQAVDRIDQFSQNSYSLWHRKSKPLYIPSGSLDKRDKKIRNPIKGWEQTLDHTNAETPWFGANLPEPVSFDIRLIGKEHPNSIGRSGFSWVGNYYRCIGKPASKASVKWWKHLYSFVKENSTGIPWPNVSLNKGRIGAYAFPEAYQQLIEGKPRDMNPI